MIAICKRLLPAICAGLLVGGPAFAVMIGDVETWNSGLQGWNQVGWADALSNPGGYLHVDFFDQADPPPVGQNWDRIYNTSTPPANRFSGDYYNAGIQDVTFDFQSYGTQIGFISLQWSCTTNSHVWKYTGFSLPPASGPWTTLDAPFSFSSDWSYGPGSTAEEFLSDMSGVSWIGIYIERNGSGAQDYSIDNFTLAGFIPEPGEWGILGAALLVTAIALRKDLFRRRLSTTG